MFGDRLWSAAGGPRFLPNSRKFRKAYSRLIYLQMRPVWRFSFQPNYRLKNIAECP
jgi:hypothetical protein